MLNGLSVTYLQVNKTGNLTEAKLAEEIFHSICRCLQEAMKCVSTHAHKWMNGK